MVIGLSKNHCDLIITDRFDFGSNMTVGSVGFMLQKQSRPFVMPPFPI